MAKAKKATKQEVKQVITGNDLEEVNGIKTTSGKIRYLASQGKTKSEIAKMLNIRYQHVRNVLITPLKKVVQE